MWWAKNGLNPVTWVMFSDTYAVFGVAGAIAATAIAVTVTGTCIYACQLFGSFRDRKVPPGPLLLSALLLFLATTLMLVAPLKHYFDRNSSIESVSAVSEISWCFLIAFILFLLADFVMLRLLRSLSAKAPDDEKLKHEARLSLDSMQLIDAPVILSIAAGLALEHFVRGNKLLILPSVGGATEQMIAAMEGMVLGLSLGGIALHVLMSQVIFLVLNIRYALQTFKNA